MATVETSQGAFEICLCGNPDGHRGPVWHPGVEHPSGAKLRKGQEKVEEQFLEAHEKAASAHAAYVKALGGQP